MKKKLPRIMACFMACLILVNTIAVPRAKASAAVAGTSALATSALASYMTATGVPLTVISGGAAAASAGTASLVSGYAAATGATYEVVTTAIAAGATISGGTIILTAAAVAVLAGITAWVISKYNVQKDGQPVPIVPDLTGKAFYNGNKYPSFSDIFTEKYPYVMIVENSSNIHRFYLTQEPLNAFVYEGKNYVGYASQSEVKPYDWYSYFVDSGEFSKSGNGAETSQFNFDASKYVWSNYDMKFSDGSLFAAYTEPVPIEDWNNPTISTKLAQDYAPLAELPETSQLVIDTGLSPQTAPEALPDAIYTQMAIGNFAPTYEEQSVTNPVPDPDPNPDSDSDVGDGLSGVLEWLKRIWNAIVSIPQAIADKFSAFPQAIAKAVEGIFVPDAALTTEITDAFAAKFSFVPTLHRLGTDLLSIGPDSKPPVVYIHLEDAEGSIDYGGTVKALDMSWYERYKEDGDRIIGGFLWLGFLWLLFKRVPAIINGGEMVQEYTADIDRGSKRRKQ